MKSYLAMGIMSGTSLDALDTVLIRARVDGNKYQVTLRARTRTEYPRKARAMLRSINQDNLLSQGHLFGEVWSELAARTVKRILRKEALSPNRITVLGVHGQTVVHTPGRSSFLGHRVGTTIQLADLSRLALRVEIPVIGNFRLADLAAGGQGAPLAPYAHRLLFGRPGQKVAIQNLGGIGNVTVLDGLRMLSAFDTGPANIWIDTVVRWKTRNRETYDRNGRLAALGTPHLSLVKKLLDHPFFAKKPPKSAGWEEFGSPQLSRHKRTLLRLSLPDAVASVTLASVAATARAYRRFVLPRTDLTEVILAGGGARNRSFVSGLKRELPDLRWVASDTYGLPVQELEAISFALLALEALRGRPTNEPRATGARHPVVCGELALSGRPQNILLR